MKKQGPIWLGLTESAHSLRPYPKFTDIRRMVARSAYDQLDYSPLLLAGTVIAMTLTYLMPPLLAIWGTGLAQAAGLLTWGLMTVAFYPIVRFYALSPLWAAALPLIASCYMLFTLDSGATALARQRRVLERACSGRPCGGIMTTGPVWDPGEKTHRDENFPVASGLVSKKHRAVILAFYRFARAADDVADDPALSEGEKIRILDRIRGHAVRAERRIVPMPCRYARRLRNAALRPSTRRICSPPSAWMRASTATPIGMNSFIIAPFRQIRSGASCSTSTAKAAAFGLRTTLYAPRFRLSITCRIAAPITAVSTASIFPSMRWPREMFQLKRWRLPRHRRNFWRAFTSCAAKTRDLLGKADLSWRVKDLRLSLEVAAIERLARKLVGMLMKRDPLSQPVHLTQAGLCLYVDQCGLRRPRTAPFCRASQTNVLQGMDDQPSH